MYYTLIYIFGNGIIIFSLIKGGGCESQMFYSQWKYIYGGTPRIKEIHDALTKLVECEFHNDFLVTIGTLCFRNRKKRQHFRFCLFWTQHISSIVLYTHFPVPNFIMFI